MGTTNYFINFTARFIIDVLVKLNLVELRRIIEILSNKFNAVNSVSIYS